MRLLEYMHTHSQKVDTPLHEYWNIRGVSVGDDLKEIGLGFMPWPSTQECLLVKNDPYLNSSKRLMFMILNMVLWHFIFLIISRNL